MSDATLEEHGRVRTIEHLFPMVFSCTKCNTIVSDSTEYLCSCQDLNCIVVSGGTNIRIAPASGNSTQGYSQDISCSKCNTELGKLYLDEFRHPSVPSSAFCLSVSAMDSYQLGTGEVRACDRLPARAAQDGAGAPESSRLQQRMADLENELVKVQNMVLLHQERLEALEGAR